MARNGTSYLAGLRDGRSIFIDGRRVADIATDPCFRNVVATAAGLYDYQAAPANLAAMAFASPTSGERVNLAWQLPNTYQALVHRRRAMEAWAERTCGMVGRSPDHVASALVGLRMGLAAFHSYTLPEPQRAAAQ